MSVITKYFCDNCKKEVEYRTMTHVKLELDPYSNYKTTRYESTYKTIDLCDECTIRLGFVLRKEDVNKEIVFQPTTADKLYQLIADMIKEVV